MGKIPYDVDKGYDESFVKILKKNDLLVFADEKLKPSSILKTNEDAIARLDEIIDKGKYPNQH